MDGFKYRLIIFDWDGTLSDSAAQIVSSMQRAVAALDLPPRADDDFRQMIGLSFEEGLGRVYPDHDTPTLIRLIHGYRRQWLGQMGEQGEPPLFTGALPGIRWPLPPESRGWVWTDRCSITARSGAWCTPRAPQTKPPTSPIH